MHSSQHYDLHVKASLWPRDRGWTAKFYRFVKRHYSQCHFSTWQFLEVFYAASKFLWTVINLHFLRNLKSCLLTKILLLIVYNEIRMQVRTLLNNSFSSSSLILTANLHECFSFINLLMNLCFLLTQAFCELLLQHVKKAQCAKLITLDERSKDTQWFLDWMHSILTLTVTSWLGCIAE